MKKNILIAAIFSLLCFSPTVHAGYWGGGGQSGLPKTGQTTEYQSGDDGTYQKGLPLSGARFIDNGDGTISDTVTGLQWVKQQELIIPGATGVHSSNQIQSARSTWANDTAYSAADLVTDSYDSTYWVCAIGHTSRAGSSGTWATDTSYTVGVVVTDGDDSSVWLCAISHTSAASGTFSDDRTANPTYWSSYDPSFSSDRSENPTYWRQTAWTSSADSLTSPSYTDWSTAIGNCEGLEYAGHSDWRLPNIKELMSIVDYGRYSRAVDPSFFPRMQSNYYWSGSSYAQDSTGAWYVDFGDGVVYIYAKDTTIYVLPVRSSQ